MTEMETWAWQTRAESVQLRTMVEPEGSRSPAEPEGYKLEVELERQLTKVEPERRGSLVEPEVWPTMVEVREHWAKVDQMGWRAKVESADWRLEVELRYPQILGPELVSSSMTQTMKGDSHLSSTHPTYLVKFPWGPSTGRRAFDLWLRLVLKNTQSEWSNITKCDIKNCTSHLLF